MKQEPYIYDYYSEMTNGILPCGKCFQGTLSLTLPFLITKNKKSGSITFDCSNSACKKQYVVSGNMRYFEFTTGIEVQAGYFGKKYNGVEPLFFVPTFNIFNVHINVPEKIKSQIESSFSLFWADQMASANSIRIAIEYLMDDLGLPEGKLHNRIKAYREKNAELGELLMAIKWIGNDGSHGDLVTKHGLLLGYEILEAFFKRFYPDDSFESIKQKAIAINESRETKKE